MAKINGKWKLVSTENFTEYCKAIGIAGDKLGEAKVLEDTSADNGLVEEYNFDGTTLKRTLIAAGGKVTRETTMDIKPGVEVDAQRIDGNPVKVVITASGDSFTRIEKGDGYESTWLRDINGDDMTVTITTGSVKCVRKYKRI